ncbi:MAG: hypothetical protein J6U54_18950 [Clostridiales bacterium]|nr:hypothetical protein [Clostridiales bacterium]
MFREIHEVKEEVITNQTSTAYKQIKPETDDIDVEDFWIAEFAKAAEEMA